jgi:hypothetical protein
MDPGQPSFHSASGMTRAASAAGSPLLRSALALRAFEPFERSTGPSDPPKGGPGSHRSSLQSTNRCRLIAFGDRCLGRVPAAPQRPTVRRPFAVPPARRIRCANRLLTPPD